MGRFGKRIVLNQMYCSESDYEECMKRNYEPRWMSHKERERYPRKYIWERMVV